MTADSRFALGTRRQRAYRYCAAPSNSDIALIKFSRYLVVLCLISISANPYARLGNNVVDWGVYVDIGVLFLHYFA